MTVTMQHRRRRPAVYDVIGVGFGPSNLALAIALREHNAQASYGRLSDVYLERQRSFGWHRGMLIDGALMQVPFLKDLVTLRNPSSRFSFPSYLKSQDRLSAFINRKSWFPSRLEFSDYLTWAADAFRDVVEYDCDVVAVSPVWSAGRVVGFNVHAKPHDAPWAATRTYCARNLVVAVGSEPWMPDVTALSDRIWHSSELAFRIEQIAADAQPARIVVAGAGQSAAEAIEYLYRRLPRTEIWVVFTQLGFRPLDDSPFVNTLFDPARVDTYFEAPAHVKQEIHTEYRNAVYSVVDRDLIEALYARTYEEAVAGSRRLRVLDLSHIVAAHEIANGVEVEIESRSTGEAHGLIADMLVCATGYRSIDPTRLLGDVAPYCRRDECGRLRLERSYRVVMAPEVQASIFVQGPSEHTHGVSSTVLSNIAGRAGEIVATIAQSSQQRRARRHAGRATHERVA